jgi:PAS domain S-box-containing protein
MTEKPTYEELEKKIQELERVESDLKKSEKALQESKERFQLLYERAPLAYQSLDENGNFIEVNPSWLEVLGYSREEVIGKSFGDFLHPDWKDHFKENFPRFKAIGEILGVEFEMVKKNGSLILVSFDGKIGKDQQGHFQQTHCIFQDITKRKEIEVGLEKTRKELAVIKIAPDEASEYAESIINTVREPLIALDQDLRVVSVSRSFYDFFKVKPEETMGQLIYDLGNKQWDIPKLRELLETILPENNLFDNYEVEHDFATIGKRTMLLNARQIEQAMGKELIILLAIEDITERKKIEAGLEKTRKELAIIKKTADEAHEFADSVINTVREPLISLDQDLRVVTASRSFYDFFKVKPEETVGQLIYDLGNKQWDIPKLRELLETILPENNPFDNYEVEHNFATIGRRTMLLNARKIEQATSKTHIILLAIEDITERMKAEALLKNSEEQYKRIFETADDGILLLEKNKFKISQANPAIMAMLGYSKEELIGKDLKDIGFQYDIETFQGIMKSLLKDGIFHSKEVALQNKAGKLVDIDIYMTDRLNLIQCNIQDISERKQEEEKLRESEAKLQAIFDTVGTGILIIDRDTQIIIEANPTAIEMTGLSKEEVIGQICHLLVCPAQVDKCPVKDLGQNIDHSERKLICADGHIKDIIKTVYPITVKGRACYIESFIDISKQKQAEEEKQNLESRLNQAQKMESIGNLAGGIAHDFNNILTSILGFSNLALSTVDKGSELEDDLNEIHTAGLRAKDLVKQILTIARQSDEEIAPLKVDSIVKEVIKFIRSSIPTTIEIQSNINSKTPIMGNQAQIHQIFMNLITNAAHAMESNGGILGINLEDYCFDDRAVLQYPNLKPGNYNKITVSDTGIGIPQDIIGSIFEPYFTTKDQGDGTGLGLATVHGIVESYGGTITVSSRQGKGTLFTIFLPVTEKKQIQHSTESEDLPRGTESILLIDDELSIVKLNQKILEALGYQVTPQTNSMDALERLKTRANDYDLIITDMTMPKLTGLKLAEAMMDIHPELPIILFTGYSKQISAQDATANNIKVILKKPVSKIDLAEIVRKVLDEANIYKGN